MARVLPSHQASSIHGEPSAALTAAANGTGSHRDRFPKTRDGSENDRQRYERRALSKQIGHRLRLDQFPRLIEVIHHDAFGIDPKSVIDGREQFTGMNRVFQR